jgi:hypothetical protein
MENLLEAKRHQLLLNHQTTVNMSLAALLGSSEAADVLASNHAEGFGMGQTLSYRLTGFY